ncbi:hypothetical protein [Actinoplanes sp. NBRC 103695]|jgi:hypothetical protein|uniref:hypothetical protein n=1 Tax=Actinoplanes sp. NBRC 103695 TaxID=3032202 RepID=UPI0024A3859D|nr:hypothetical protein [Actinoplanes sp. NBRC 103695]GLY93727.1 hypothetical protein Acsp02_09830 [Actinoplanes sp. NBRC 103695]
MGVDLLTVIAIAVVAMLIKFALDSLRGMAKRTWMMAQGMFSALGVVALGFMALLVLAGSLIVRFHS